jgi:hypothetical protein
MTPATLTRGRPQLHYRHRGPGAELRDRHPRELADRPHAPFSEWKHTFTDPRLCAAIVDRLTYNAHIIETGSESYRLAQAALAHASQ